MVRRTPRTHCTFLAVRPSFGASLLAFSQYAHPDTAELPLPRIAILVLTSFLFLASLLYRNR
jgi:hypothetical protein